MSQQRNNEGNLLTQRLCLRPLSENDAPLLYPILSHPDVMKWTPSGPVHSEDEAREWIRTRAIGRHPFQLVIESEAIKGKGECIGTIGCYGLPHVGYLIHPQYADRGYATEALRAIIPGFFEILDREGKQDSRDVYIEARTLFDNTASQRVLTKCGFGLWQDTAAETQGAESSAKRIVTYRLAKADVTQQVLPSGEM